MDSNNVSVGDEVVASPVGQGTVTGFSEAGFPEINGKAVSYFTRRDGAKYGAFGTLDTPQRKMVAEAHEVAPMSTGNSPAFVAQGGTGAPGHAPSTPAPAAPAPAPAPAQAPATPASTPGHAPSASAEALPVPPAGTMPNAQPAAATANSHRASHAVPGLPPEVASGDQQADHVAVPPKAAQATRAARR